MKEIKETRKKVVEVPVTSYVFNAKYGNLREDLTVENGEIVHTGFWTSRTGGGCVKGDEKFEESCRDTISFISEHNREELKKLYKALSEGSMKEYCKALLCS